MSKNLPKIDKNFLEAYKNSGGNPQHLIDENTPSLTVSHNKVLSVTEIAGIHMEAEELPDGVKATIKVDEGVEYDEPIHICFGMMATKGRQEVQSEYIIGKNAKVSVIAHCTFPNSINVIHEMEAKVTVEEGGDFEYHEEHFHGVATGAFVRPRTKALIKKKARYANTFKLVGGRVGKLDIHYEADLQEKAIVELLTKAAGIKDDKIKITEIFNLNGAYARGIVKSRVVVRNDSTSEFFAEANGNAPNSRGHVDCTEILADNARASAIPKVTVNHESAKITHEASIGKIDNKKIETLMARGLTEDEAIDVIIKGLLK
ncbi:MAG: SufD family Fe-S cluster assembly protein [Asgard group archaeon]|nr:SufD family Fe-S cluster assembly protein [Asgard group archaeon]